MQKQLQIHPFDYCYNALNIKLCTLMSSSPEYQIIRQYIKNGYSNFHNDFIINIFAMERSGETERYTPWKNIKNRTLLWHGSKMSNYMGILYQGLRIAPPEAPVTGYMFGKGVYFADNFQKSFGYCTPYEAPKKYVYNSNGQKEKIKDKSFNLLLLCEVALGDMYEKYQSEYITELASKNSIFNTKYNF